VGQWLDEKYPEIAKRAKQEGAEIHWGDETGLRSDDVRGRSYAPKGQTPLLRVNAWREGLSVISTVTNKGEMCWKIFSGALNAKILIGFLERLTRKQRKRVFLILDNLRVHHSKLVKRRLAENAEKIEVLYLPSYSPELNPDDLLNSDLKQRVTTVAPARTKRASPGRRLAQCAAFRNNRNASGATSSGKTSDMLPKSDSCGPLGDRVKSGHT